MKIIYQSILIPSSVISKIINNLEHEHQVPLHARLETIIFKQEIPILKPMVVLLLLDAHSDVFHMLRRKLFYP